MLYDKGETYTQTVFDHLDAFQKFSKNNWGYLNIAELSKEKHNLKNFQAIFVHYSVRLPLDQITEEFSKILTEFDGFKGLFIQDEYDHFLKTKFWIKKLNFSLVFTVTPAQSISLVYPNREFPNQIFVNNLTGYAPADIGIGLSRKNYIPPSQRDIYIGYRGRSLHSKYGQLGRDKLSIGINVKMYCKASNIEHNIEWDEQSRIYGDRWFEFIASCRAMLGTESGSNVFDYDGNLKQTLDGYKKSHSHLSDDEFYEKFIKPLEHPGLMNQISPRIFEMASASTVMILYDGAYSNILTPNIHYLPLKRDISNLPSIIAALKNSAFIDEMAQRTKEDIINSGKYSYKSFIAMVDDVLSKYLVKKSTLTINPLTPILSSISSAPTRAPAPLFSGNTNLIYKVGYKTLKLICNPLPKSIKMMIKRGIGRA